MSYRVIIPKGVSKSLEALPGNLQDKIVEALEDLENNPRPTGAKKLKGKNGWRVRTW